MTATTTELGGYSGAERRRTQLVRITEQVGGIASELGLGALSDAIAITAERVRSDAFVVTVLGDFNTGKSTLINALLGSDTLPRLPVECTALLTEVQWGDEPTALLYRRTQDGQVDPDPEPVEVRRLPELIVVDVDDPDAQSPYAKAEVHWPLELCRNRVVLVDSPGLNADPLREQLTMEYLQRTDAVVFVMDAQMNMKRNEVDFMRTHLEGHDPFFVINKINKIDEEERGLVRRSAETRLRQARPDHSGDVDRMFWVDALAGIRARVGDDREAWTRSEVGALQSELERFLTTDRHKIKILAPARQLRMLRREIGQSIGKQEKMLTESLTELDRRYAEAQAPMDRLRADAERITTALGNRIGDLRDEVARMIAGRLRTLAGELPELANESLPDNKLSIKPWKTAEQANAVAAEVAELTARAAEARFGEWVTAELQPVITDRVAGLAEGLDAEVAQFENDLDAMRVDMSGLASDAGARAGKQDESALSRTLAGVGGTLLAGPAAGLAGARFGPREMAKALLPTIAISMVWLFTPFGWGVLAAGLVAQALFGSFSMLRGAEKKIKAKVGEEMATEMRGRIEGDAGTAADTLAKQLDEVRKAVRAGLDTQISTFAEEVEAVLTAKRAGETAARERAAELTTLADQLSTAMDELDNIVDEIAAL